MDQASGLGGDREMGPSRLTLAPTIPKLPAILELRWIVTSFTNDVVYMHRQVSINFLAH